MAEFNSDEIMAIDFNAPTLFSNLYRVRAENDFVVLDLAYMPPIASNEVEHLKQEPIKVGQRVILTKEHAQNLCDLIQKVAAEAGEEPFTPSMPSR